MRKISTESKNFRVDDFGRHNDYFGTMQPVFIFVVLSLSVYYLANYGLLMRNGEVL